MSHSQRRLPSKKQRPIIRIITNGKKTETEYFKLQKDFLNIKNLKVEVSFENAGNPKHLINKIQALYTSRDIDPEIDRIYCVIDVDEATNDMIRDALRIKKEYVELILSNPNFEIWYLLHFNFYCTKFNINDTYGKLKNYIPTYSKNEIESCFGILKDNERNAIKNAARLREHHKEHDIEIPSCEANPCTDVDLIVNFLNSYSYNSYI